MKAEIINKAIMGAVFIFNLAFFAPSALAMNTHPKGSDKVIQGLKIGEYNWRDLAGTPSVDCVARINSLLSIGEEDHRKKDLQKEDASAVRGN